MVYTKDISCTKYFKNSIEIILVNMLATEDCHNSNNIFRLIAL